MNNTSSTFLRMFTIAKHYTNTASGLFIHGEYIYSKFSLFIHGEYSLNPMLSLPMDSTKLSIPHFPLKSIPRKSLTYKLRIIRDKQNNS